MPISMLIYATSTDLATWVSPVPASPDALLRRASGLVRKVTRAALYDVDSAGKPSDPETVDAFRDATCAQVAFWIAADIDPAAAGVGPTTPVVVSKAMGDRSIGYADLSTSVTVAQARADASEKLCLEAWEILNDAGLLNGQPNV